jgi:hypothetical protein
VATVQVQRREERDVLARVRQVAAFYNGRRPANTIVAIETVLARLDVAERQLANVRAGLSNGNGKAAA